MSDAIQVQHNGHVIEWNERFDYWVVKVGERELRDPRLSELKKKVDRVAKAKAPRLKVWYPYRGKVLVAEITSYDGSKARISYDGDRGTVYDSDLYDFTEENRKLFEEIAPLRDQQRKLGSQIHALEAKLTRTAIKQHWDLTRKIMAGEVGEGQQ